MDCLQMTKGIKGVIRLLMVKGVSRFMTLADQGGGHRALEEGQFSF